MLPPLGTEVCSLERLESRAEIILKPFRKCRKKKYKYKIIRFPILSAILLKVHEPVGQEVVGARLNSCAHAAGT